ncbi:MAG: hypothetical protein M5U26_29525 [Planctomycetota bacterium]|nr:hypothetical protein [Planctomycetota bacterium]
MKMAEEPLLPKQTVESKRRRMWLVCFMLAFALVFSVRAVYLMVKSYRTISRALAAGALDKPQDDIAEKLDKMDALLERQKELLDQAAALQGQLSKGLGIHRKPVRDLPRGEFCLGVELANMGKSESEEGLKVLVERILNEAVECRFESPESSILLCHGLEEDYAIGVKAELEAAGIKATVFKEQAGE